MTIQTDEYNGWANRETWATVLWLNNDEGLYSMAREVVGCDCDGGENPRRIHGEDALQSWVENDLFDPDTLASNRELRNMRDEVGSLWRVDWRAVADAFRDEG